MKIRVTNKSVLSWPSLTRGYTFDILDDEDNILLGSQNVVARPDEIVNVLKQILIDYEAAYFDDNDLEVGMEV